MAARTQLAVIAIVGILLTACTAAPVRAPAVARSDSGSITAADPTSDRAAPTRTPTKPKPKPKPTPKLTEPPAVPPALKSTTSAAAAPSTSSPQTATAPAGAGPVIVIDPGHAPAIQHVDPTTGLNDSDYENEPEMRDVFAVALLVRAKLIAAGYRVVMTKNSVDDQVPLGQRAAVANMAHAALALSIHDQAGPSGGIGFSQGNNIVYYQSVGDYRLTPNGTKVVFTNSAVAATSLKYGRIFQSERSAVEGVPVTLQGNTGYDLGSRGLAGGDIWIVQLLSKVPWIYNESGGNSAGTVGLDAADKATYADSLVAAVEKCVPVG